MSDDFKEFFVVLKLSCMGFIDPSWPVFLLIDSAVFILLAIVLCELRKIRNFDKRGSSLLKAEEADLDREISRLKLKLRRIKKMRLWENESVGK